MKTSKSIDPLWMLERIEGRLKWQVDFENMIFFSSLHENHSKLHFCVSQMALYRLKETYMWYIDKICYLLSWLISGEYYFFIDLIAEFIFCVTCCKQSCHFSVVCPSVRHTFPSRFLFCNSYSSGAYVTVTDLPCLCNCLIMSLMMNVRAI